MASDDEIRDYLRELRHGGRRGREGTESAMAKFGISRNHAYRLWLEVRDAEATNGKEI